MLKAAASFSRGGSRGSVLLLAVFFLLLLITLAGALFILCPSELQSARLDKTQSQAYYLAEGGIIKAVARIEAGKALIPEVADSVITSAGTPYIAPFSLGNLECRVAIQEAGTAGSHSSLGAYLITATVNLNDGIDNPQLKQIKAVILQDSFAKYAYFTDTEQTDSNNPLWWRDDYRVEGPFHINSDLYMALTDGYYTDPASRPVFDGPVSITGNLICRSYSGLDVNPADEQQYNKLFKLGQGGLTTGGSRIEFPDNNLNLRNLVWPAGSGQTFPANKGVYVQPGGNLADKGILIKGQVNKMTLSVDLANNSVVEVVQGGDYYKIISRSSGGQGYTCIMKGCMRGDIGVITSQPEYYLRLGDNLGSQVIFCTGDIKNFSGTNKGRRIIAADIENDKKIEIAGDVLRADTTAGNKPNGDRDALGLIAQKVVIKDPYLNSLQPPSSMSPSEPLYDVNLYAVIMAGRKGANGRNGFYAENIGDNNCNRPAGGVIKIFGGLIQAVKGPVGNLHPRQGYGRELYYDPLASRALGNFFPAVPKFHLVGWEEN